MEFFLYIIFMFVISYIAWKMDEINKNRKQRQLEEEKLESERLKKEKEKQLLEIQEKEKEAKRLEKLKKERLKKEELEKKYQYITNVICKYDKFVIAFENTMKLITVRLQLDFDIMDYEKELYNIYDERTIDVNIKLLEKIISLLPLEVTAKELMNMYSLERFKKFAFEVDGILGINKKNIEEYNDLKFNMYLSELKTNKKIRFCDKFSKDKEINSLGYIYALYISILYELIIFDQNIEILKNDIELNTIYYNLIKTNTNPKYIYDKMYEIISNLYKQKLINIQNQEDYEIIVSILLEQNNLHTKKSINNLYEITEENEIKIKYGQLSDKIDEEIFKTIEIDFLKSISQNIKFEDFIRRLIVLDEMSKKDYDLAIQDRKQKNAQKEMERLLKGDMSKEIEMQKQVVEYSNVQNGYEFEEYVANLYKELGYKIEEVTKKSGDQGADVIAYKNNIKYVIQVKFYNNPVGNKAVQEVVGAKGMYKADKGIVITNSTFTQSAIELAKANNIELVNGEKIEEYKKIIIDNI